MSTPLVRKSTQSIEPKTENKKISLGFIEEKENIKEEKVIQIIDERLQQKFETKTILMENLLKKEIGSFEIVPENVNDCIKDVNLKCNDKNILLFLKKIKSHSFEIEVSNNNNFDILWNLTYTILFF
jgi:hypothetical protein